eukprot:TRINITY_DN82535_c0_g1_i1.p1 TRINITY_DN82535_c0_g1~~TRINITY_DN82535_c0_g1_i1.p1  ORF type:complete len:302 (-),score=51.11 TRINITY_DN82535_c0_g1_i1:83-949(-)
MAAGSSHWRFISPALGAPARAARGRRAPRPMRPDGEQALLDEADREWRFYDPDADTYDVRTAPLLPPVEDPDVTLQKQIAALQRRVAAGGDPDVLLHYKEVLRTLEHPSSPTPSASPPACKHSLDHQSRGCVPPVTPQRRMHRHSSNESDASTNCPESPASSIASDQRSRAASEVLVSAISMPSRMRLHHSGELSLSGKKGGSPAKSLCGASPETSCWGVIAMFFAMLGTTNLKFQCEWMLSGADSKDQDAWQRLAEVLEKAEPSCRVGRGAMTMHHDDDMNKFLQYC